MANFVKRESRALEKIAKEITKLDNTLEKLDDTDSKVKGFVEQEKAIHEIKSIIRTSDKVEKIENEAVDKVVDDAEVSEEQYNDLVQSISNEFDKLDTTLDKLDTTNSKAEAFIEQKKALHEAKEIVKKANLL